MASTFVCLTQPVLGKQKFRVASFALILFHLQVGNKYKYAAVETGILDSKHTLSRISPLREKVFFPSVMSFLCPPPKSKQNVMVSGVIGT